MPTFADLPAETDLAAFWPCLSMSMCLATMLRPLLGMLDLLTKLTDKFEASMERRGRKAVPVPGLGYNWV